MGCRMAPIGRGALRHPPYAYPLCRARCSELERGLAGGDGVALMRNAGLSGACGAQQCTKSSDAADSVRPGMAATGAAVATRARSYLGDCAVMWS